MTKLYIIRHAEAEGNLYRRVHGHYDSRITDMGHEQLEALQLRFSQIPIDAVYSSDLQRAVTTARAISVPRGLEIQTTPRLREVNMGHWEDSTWARLEREDLEQLQNFSRNPGRWDIGSNEKFEALKARLVSVVSEIAARHPGETVAIVSHGNAIRTLLTHVLNLPSERFGESAHCDNAGVSLLEVDEGGMRIVFMNDNSHIPPEISTFARQRWWREEKRKDGNMDFFPLNLEKDRDIGKYLSHRRAAWTEFFGNTEDFCEKSVLETARAQSKANPRAVVEAVLGEQSAGLLELDLIQGQEEGVGTIACFYLAPAFRGQRLAIQFVGHAVSVFRPLERGRLALWIGETHQEAYGFFRRYGFQKTGEKGPLWILEKDI